MSLKPNEVKTPNIASYAVTESKLADNSVTTNKIKDGAVKTNKIADKQVTGEKIADRSISNNKIIDGAITGIKIADGSITKDKISDGVLGRPLTPPVATVEIADNAVSEAKLQNNSVTRDKIKDGEITNAKIAANTITASKIAANAVGNSELQDNSVTSPKIASGSIYPSEVNTINAPAEGLALTYDAATQRFKYASVGGGGVTKHIDLTDKEVAGVIDHADGSITPAKLSFTPITRPLSPAVSASEIATDAIETAKIKDLNVTKAKAEIGFGRYVPLAKSTYDINVMDKDGAAPDLDTINPDWLELASLVPAGAIAVHLLMEIQTDTLAGTGMPNPCYIEGNQTTKKYNRLKGSTIFDEQPSEQVYDYQGIIMIDADRKLDVFASSDTTIFRVTVLGYFI